MSGELEASGFTVGNALGILLTTESLMFAALSLTVALSTPGRRIRRLPVKGTTLGTAAVAVLVLVAIGAFCAWLELFDKNRPGAFTEVAIAAAILIAIVAEPILGILLALGLRTER